MLNASSCGPQKQCCLWKPSLAFLYRAYALTCFLLDPLSRFEVRTARKQNEQSQAKSYEHNAKISQARMNAYSNNAKLVSIAPASPFSGLSDSVIWDSSIGVNYLVLQLLPANAEPLLLRTGGIHLYKLGCVQACDRYNPLKRKDRTQSDNVKYKARRRRL